MLYILYAMHTICYACYVLYILYAMHTICYACYMLYMLYAMHAICYACYMFCMLYVFFFCLAVPYEPGGPGDAAYPVLGPRVVGLPFPVPWPVGRLIPHAPCCFGAPQPPSGTAIRSGSDRFPPWGGSYCSTPLHFSARGGCNAPRPRAAFFPS